MTFFDIVNPYGAVFAVVLALPHIIYRRMHTIDRSRYDNKAMYYLDRMARFACLVLMAFHTGILERGFTEPKELMKRFWLIAAAVLLLVYLVLWALYFKQPRKKLARVIAGVSAAAVVLSGILQVNTLLFTFGLVYFIGELYIISKQPL